MPAYRVIREENVIRLLRLEGPDATGNQRWVVAASLRPNDMVQFAPKGFKKAKDMSDADLIYHIVGGNK